MLQSKEGVAQFQNLTDHFFHKLGWIGWIEEQMS
jgi:hypothetical protein